MISWLSSSSCSRLTSIAEIRVFFVEIVDGHVLQVLHGSDEPSVNPGFLQGRMSK